MLKSFLEGTMDYLKSIDSLNDYDKTDASSIESYSQKLIGKSFQEILDMDLEDLVEESTSSYFENRNFKGGLGNLVEKHFFHYEPNSDSNPDFPEAGCELKVTPFKQNKNGSYSAKERLVLTMINYMDIIEEPFESSHFWYKSKLLLLIYYLWREDANRLDYRIKFSKLFSPSSQDLEIIKNDYKIIQDKVRKGLAHELSGSDTLYLEACTKASTSADTRQQPYSDIPAKPRAFAFKTSYMTYVLNNYIMGKDNQDESIYDTSSDIPFEEYIEQKINRYIGLSVDELCEEFNLISYKPPKNLEALLAYKILGIKGNKAAEFEKAGIVVKAIRLSQNNTLREHISFPNFQFTEIVKETWEEASIRNYLDSTKFFFIVYKYDANSVLRLKGCQFWSMPLEDLNTEVRDVWRKTRIVIRNGIKVTTRNGIDYNNLPSPSENKVCHIRPHAKNKNDTYPLPTGGSFTKQSFWLNNTYIVSQLDDSLIN